jgi:hypothetical protein
VTTPQALDAGTNWRSWISVDHACKAEIFDLAVFKYTYLNICINHFPGVD